MINLFVVNDHDCTSFCTAATRSRPFSGNRGQRGRGTQLARGDQPLSSLLTFNHIPTVVFAGREFRDGINEI